MNNQSQHIDFSTILTPTNSATLLNQLTTLESLPIEDFDSESLSLSDRKVITSQNKLISYLIISQQQWQWLNSICTDYQSNVDSQSVNTLQTYKDFEHTLTDWLISLFNTLFLEQKVELVRGEQEPEYFPIQGGQPARIEFAHGFFASALHEISHWCVAGRKRRLLNDFGYWYAPDGRTVAQQQAFERVEIKPQALECLFTLACGHSFQVSQDNLSADFDTSTSTFAYDVYMKAKEYVAKPHTLPRDAKTLLAALLLICTSNQINM
ncbi:elongation factor P hydroxylase [uncultured Psychrobacter sp.]|uniref:elongation factor P hydroxylase n=1 Tax=uncultured Psychrobacter sp. TaxID=259303 RepID=UPI00262CFA7B|nr:elongation factor P hydroxylase [uncultured Psychrobacter sp.]